MSGFTEEDRVQSIRTSPILRGYRPPGMMRPQSELGWLMLQWLGVLVPGAFREEVRTWGGRRPGKAAAAAAARAYVIGVDKDPRSTKARRDLPVRSEIFDVDRRVEEADTARFTAGDVLTWPSAEAMLSGEPPEGYDQALLRAAVEGDGSAVTHVDPEAGTVTVSSKPPEGFDGFCARCGHWIGGMCAGVCMNCDVETPEGAVCGDHA